MNSDERGLEHMRITRSEPKEDDATSIQKSFQDFLTYLKAGFTIEYCICKVVADYRLWRKQPLTPFESDLLVQYKKIFSRGDRHIYI